MKAFARREIRLAVGQRELDLFELVRWCRRSAATASAYAGCCA
jgi:hypothetical protein